MKAGFVLFLFPLEESRFQQGLKGIVKFVIRQIADHFEFGTTPIALRHTPTHINQRWIGKLADKRRHFFRVGMLIPESSKVE